jgi:uncharacterized protein (TIGR02453 family)
LLERGRGTGGVKSGAYFTSRTFGFLKELAAHNDRDWFQANKESYQEDVKEPSLRFIVDFADHLKKISPHFRADPRGNGGSLFRIHRDTRFSKDKSPYKTHTGIQFRHEAGKDAHAPGYYLHLEPGNCFVGLGIWHPDGATLRKIREGLVEDVSGWKKSVGGKAFRDRLELTGDSLKRPPRGFDPEHPLVEDLKRKDFIAVAPLTDEAVVAEGFLMEFNKLCKAGTPFMALLAKTLEIPF